MATWMITGATGFLGRHVLEQLPTEFQREGRTGDTVVVLGRRCPKGWPEQLFVRADFNDPTGLRGILNDVAPDHVIHTAGRTPPASDEDFYQGNFWATIRLLNALRSLSRKVRVTLAGSAAELGFTPSSALPVSESYPCAPTDAYGRSKHLATVAGLAERSPLEVSVARVFNPIGPGQPPTQAFQEFAAQLMAETADPLPLFVGNLEARRDFIDVRDVARALIATLASRSSESRLSRGNRRIPIGRRGSGSAGSIEPPVGQGLRRPASPCPKRSSRLSRGHSPHRLPYRMETGHHL